MRRRYFIAISWILVAGLVASAVWSSERRNAPRVQVSFIAYTNSSSGKKLSQFRITNDSKVPVYRWDLFEVRYQGPPASVHVDPNRRTSVILNAGQSEIMSVAAPAPAGPWRGIALCSFYNPLSFRLSQLKLKFMGRGIGMRSYEVQSGWIDQ
jgi:hypothetical protein